MKKIKTIIMICTFFVCVVIAEPVLASHTKVTIKVETATAANMYYEILDNGKRITKDMYFTLYDEDGNVVFKIKTKDGILFKENVPFGKYTLVSANGKKFRIIINKKYVKTQHILKPLEIGDKKHVIGNKDMTSPQTGYFGVIKILNVIFVSMMIIIFILLKKINHEKNEK